MNYDLIMKVVGVAVISAFSGFVFLGGHEFLHSIFGTSATGIGIVSIGMAAMSVVGYLMWTTLTSVPLSVEMFALTSVSGLVIHVASHMVAGFQAVSVVGGWMFWLGAIGATLNYFIRL
jgi:hypothetical protein